MRYLRVLHNGDLRKEALQPSPHWTIIIHEDGSMGGEVLMRDWRRLLPKDFRSEVRVASPDAHGIGQHFVLPHVARAFAGWTARRDVRIDSAR